MRALLLIFALALNCWAANPMRGPSFLSNLAPQSASQSSLLSGLVAYWKLDSDGTDSTGSYSLTPVSSPYFTQDGIVGNCFSNDTASSKYLRITNSGLYSETLTVSLWYKSTNTVSSRRMLFLGAGDFFSTNATFEIYFSSAATVALNVRTNPTTTSARTLTYFAAANTNTVWHHVAAVIMPSAAYLWVDGTARATGTLDASLATCTQYRFTVGATSADSPNVANAWGNNLDEISLHHRALSTNEIQTLYNSGAGRTHPFTGAP